MKCSCIKYSFMEFMLQACVPKRTEEIGGLCLMYLSVLVLVLFEGFFKRTLFSQPLGCL